MSYADAASKGTSYSRNQGNKYYNVKMDTCYSKGVSCEKLVDALHEGGWLRDLSAIQKVKYGIMYALVVENSYVRQELLVKGLAVNGIRLSFNHHNEDQLKVYVSNIPCGVSEIYIRRCFDSYGFTRVVKKLRRNTMDSNWILGTDLSYLRRQLNLYLQRFL